MKSQKLIQKDAETQDRLGCCCGNTKKEHFGDGNIYQSA